MTPGDVLIDGIAEKVAEKLLNWSGLSNRLLTLEAAAQYMGMTPGALRQRHDIPRVADSRKLRYDRRDLDHWIDQAPREGV